MAEWKDLILADERSLHIAAVITYGSGLEQTLTGGEIACVTIDEGADGPLLPGAVLSAGCRMDLSNDDGRWSDGHKLIGATLTVKLGADDGETTVWKNLGVFQVENALCLESEALLRLSCADSIASELYEPFADSLSYPATLAQIWHAIVGQTRYVWEGTVPNAGAVVDQKPDWQNASLRSAMGMVAAAAGCFVRVDRDGFLRLEPLVSGREYAIGPDDYLRLERDDAFYGPVDALRLTPVDGEERVYTMDGESALHAVSVSGNPLFRADAPHLDSLAQGMLSRVAGFYTRKADFTWKGDPEIRVGDRIRINTLSGEVFTGVLSRQSLSYDRRFRASCSCALPEKMDSGVRRAITPEGGLNAAALTGAVNGALLSAGSVTTNKLAAASVTAEKLAAGAVDAGAVSAIAAKIGRLTAKDIQTDSLAAALAAFTVITAGTADFDRATVQHLVSRALNLSFGAADELFISNLRVAYGQMVQAAIGNLCIRASDGNYYRIDVDPGGSVTAVPAALSDAEIESGQTEGGRIILETGITTESLAASNLLATYALVNRIDAARIDVDELFAREAFVARLITTDISSNSFIQQSITDTAAGVVEQYVRLDGEGLHIGKRDSASEVLLDSASASVVVSGRRFSSFAANYVQFGDYQMRRTADGGLAFKRKGV